MIFLKKPLSRIFKQENAKLHFIPTSIFTVDALKTARNAIYFEKIIMNLTLRGSNLTSS